MNISFNSIGIATLIFGYILGSLPTGYLAGKWLLGIDLREMGSGSTGATNVLRYVGKKAGLVVFIFDVLKGFASVYLAQSLGLNDSWHVAAGLASLIGHIWPIWLKGKGGKAVATGLGLLLGVSWQVGFACLGIFLITFSKTRIVSLSSIIASISLPILMILSFGDKSFSPPYMILSLFSMVIVLWRHRSNWGRILNGNEPKIDFKN